DRLADVVGAAEGEGEVRDPPRDEGTWTALLDQPRRLDKGARVLGVLLDPRPDSQDVRVEDQVLWGETGLPGQQPVGALADRDLPLDRIRLALLVERHHDDRGAVAARPTCLLE